MEAIPLIALALIVYLFPAVIASMRGHQSSGAILALNILLGWSFVGWVIAFVWACTAVTKTPRPADRRATRLCPYCAEEILTAAHVCKHCGRDVVAAGAKGRA